ncbi:SDR family oxidoreductase [Emcibacter nanhaiensis]|uniref:SDR family oxidoreductase n=1 Tax=Emcibacter nanhaiensis TaxID=1505037 RepID=A0A501PIK6_9PROT|nr:SDR family oxidoreductase [Emcibacter nanhaiensis]TPD59852.1 SDR family oxidoreductase [Emcibacter nanhaiensis]
MRFKDKTALVIGGNSGIGLSTAKGLSEEGAKVYITGRNPDTLAAAEQDIPGLKAFQADMADLDGLTPVLDVIREETGRIDALFVNAGIGTFINVRDVTPEIWDQVHNVNLRGAFFTTQAALPLMGKGGSIVITGSIGSTLGMPGNVIYSSAKAGLRAMARILAVELVKDGIRVNVVSPGPIETPLINRNVGMDPSEVDGLRQVMISGVPMHRMGEPEEVARAALFLASEEASFITGIDMFVDGGSLELR